MNVLRPSTLASLAFVAAALGWTGARVWSSIAGASPDVPRLAPFALVFLAAVLVGGGLIMRRRVQRRQPGTPPISADLAVRLLVLAQASAIVGSLAAGGYVGAAVYYAAELDVPFRRTAAGWALGSAIASLAVVGAAVWLERECRVPPEDDPDERPARA